jgi:hypothetical protein
MQVILAVAMVIFTAYAAGRVHQWSRHGFEREEAFREGYNLASHALFHLATRTPSSGTPRRDPAEAVTAPAPTASGATGVYRTQTDLTRYDVAS